MEDAPISTVHVGRPSTPAGHDGRHRLAGRQTGTFTVKRGLADMLRGGVIMDVVTAEQARIAEDAGAVAVMALERVPSDIRAQGGVARMSDPALIEAIQQRGDHPGHGQGPHRALRRGPGPRGARRRLHRRERGAHPGRRGAPHRQVGLPGALRVRRHQPGRGAAAHLRGRGSDPLQGRGRHRQHRRGRPPPPLDPGRHRRAHPGRRGRALRLGQAAGGPDRPRPRGGRHRARCPCRCSAPAASPPRPTPPS